MTRNKLNKFDYFLHVNVSLNHKTVTLCIPALSFVKSQESRAQKSVKTGNLMGVYVLLPIVSNHRETSCGWIKCVAKRKRVKIMINIWPHHPYVNTNYCYIHDGFYSIFSESLKCFLFFNHEVYSIVHSTFTSPKWISIADSLLGAFVFTSFDFLFKWINIDLSFFII